MTQTFMLFLNSSLQSSIYTISCESRENNPSRQLKKNEKNEAARLGQPRGVIHFSNYKFLTMECGFSDSYLSDG